MHERWRTFLLLGTCLLMALTGLSTTAVAVPASALPTGPLTPAAGPGSNLPIAPGWSMYHADPLLDGVGSSTVPAHPHVLWQVQLPLEQSQPPGPGSTENPYQASPDFWHGMVIVASANTVFELNATTGAIANSFDTLGPIGDGPFTATPIITAAGFIGLAQDGARQNAGVLNLTTGALWQVCALSGHDIASSLAPLPGGDLLAADDHGNVNTISLTTTTCNPVTYNRAPNNPGYDATPTIAYVGPQAFAFLPDVSNGAVDVWKVPQGGFSSAQIALPPSVTNLYGSMAASNLTNGSQLLPVGFLADDVGTGSTSHLWAVNLTAQTAYADSLALPSGTTTDSGIEGTPAVVAAGGSDAEVFVGNNTGNLSAYTFSDAGKGSFTSLWGDSCAPHTEFIASPVVGKGGSGTQAVVDGTASGWLCAFNANDGELLWKQHLNGSLYASPLLAQGNVYAFSSTGELEAISLDSPSVNVQVPPPAVAGTTVPVDVDVGAVNLTGAPGGPLHGATVTLAVSAGSVVGGNPATSNSAGVAQFNWSTPAGTTTSIFPLLTASVAAPGYATASGSATAQVNPAPPLLELRPSVTPAATSVVVGRSTAVTVSVLGNGGGAIVGASVVLTAVGGGTLTPIAGKTGAGGTFSSTYTAPATVPPSPAVLLVANVSDAGYLAAENGSALEILSSAQGLPGMTLTIPTNLSVGEGGQVPFEVDAANATDGLPVVGAAVVVSSSPSNAGTFVGSGLTNGAGIAFWNFTAGSVPEAVLTLVAVSDAAYAGSSGFLAITIQPPAAAPGTLTLVAQASQPVLAGSSVTILLNGTVHPLQGAAAPAAGATASLQISAGTGSLSSPSVLFGLAGDGVATLDTSEVVAPELVGVLVTLTLGSYTSATTTLTVLVLPHPLSVLSTVNSALTPGSSCTLSVTVQSDGSPAAGIWVNASVGAGGGGSASFASASSVQTGANGVATFQLTLNGVAGDTIELVVAGARAGYAPGWGNLTVTLVAPTTSSTATSSGSLSLLDTTLLALVLILLVGFLAAVFLRRRRSPPTDAGAGAAAAGSGDVPGAVPRHEYDEEVDHHEAGAGGSPQAGDAAPAAVVLPAAGAASTGKAGAGAEFDEANEPEVGSDDAASPSEASEPGELHVEHDRNLGEERPSVEESNPYAGQVEPEDVNPNVRRVPKELLQPSEMSIQSGAAPAAPASAPAPPKTMKLKRKASASDATSSGTPPGGT